MLLYVVLLEVMPKIGERSLGQPAVTGAHMERIHSGRRIGVGHWVSCCWVVALLLATLLPLSEPVVAIAILLAGSYLHKHRYHHLLNIDD